ncbi:MAG: nuclear transport factor 2 family protein [Gemmatimonadaceae bacterium]|nr:nuclear transport factor 2 family protein [Gemmatimonadaceae bacterium]
MNPLILCFALACPSAVLPPVLPVGGRTDTPAQVAQSLLDADRAFAAAGARTDMLSALSAMFSDGVIMPSPQGGLAIGKSAVLAALRATPDATTARAIWTPIRVGISADGEHGFTFGYMTLRKPDSTRVPLKYMAYWVREAGVWHVLAYKRGRSAGPAPEAALMAPALPTALVAVRRDAKLGESLRHELMHREDAFSQDAQRIGLGNAFVAFGSSDAVNMGGAASATYVVGATAIATLVAGGDMKASPVTWGADTAFVASSGDLGITFGVIRPKNPPAGSDPGAGSPFFTIWRRADSRSPWRYVAE